MNESVSEPLDEAAVAALGRGLDHVQTHLSHVFLASERVYKLRKAVDFGFVSFATRAERNADCVREVVLNRRLAPDVYLGVAPVEGSGGAARLGALRPVRPGEILDPSREHCVVMRRLPAARDALSLLSNGRLGADALDRLAITIARFHEANRLGRPAPFEREAWLERIRGPVEANFDTLATRTEIVSGEEVERTRRTSRRAFERLGDTFDARRVAGRVVDAHGDLHLQHVFFEQDDSQPLLIDCLEFSDELRRIDAASEVAFLAMDLRYRRRRDLAESFLAAYARESDDFDLYRVVDFFTSYRAGVRAKVAALAATGSEIDAAQRSRAAESARSHFTLAREALDEAPRGALVVVCGSVGTGKSSAARIASGTLGGATIASDRVRKRLAGLAPTARTRGAEQERLYAAETTESVYVALLERAAPVVASGRAAILDATFSRRRHRGAALAFARERGLAALLVEVRCDAEVARERLARRAAQGADPSDAGPERLAASLASFEPTSECAAGEKLVVETDREGWEARLADALRRRFGA